MKKVLFAGLLVLAGVSVSAQNLIKNEKFATEVKTKVTNANKATAGEWFIMNNEADGVTTSCLGRNRRCQISECNEIG